MQTLEPDSDGSADFYIHKAVNRLLEDPDGRWRLVGHGDKRLARAVNVTERPFKDEGIGAGVCYIIERLYWDHIQGLLQLEGAPPQQLVGPKYLVLNAVPSAAPDPRPHLKDLVLARFSAQPEGDFLEVFDKLRRRFC